MAMPPVNTGGIFLSTRTNADRAAWNLFRIRHSK